MPLTFSPRIFLHAENQTPVLVKTRRARNEILGPTENASAEDRGAAEAERGRNSPKGAWAWHIAQFPGVTYHRSPRRWISLFGVKEGTMWISSYGGASRLLPPIQRNRSS